MAESSWEALDQLIQATNYEQEYDSEEARVQGKTNPHTRLRMFGQTGEPRITLFRDHHAWCPYCQKIWLYLEEKKIPYKIAKVTMFCYGEKEDWYKRIVPSGMLPAILIDKKYIVTESDQILEVLEQEFGVLNEKHGKLGSSPEVMRNRQLERDLFRAWCTWLCHEHSNDSQEKRAKQLFVQTAQDIERSLEKYEPQGPYFLGSEYGICDIIFTPYVERMNASLYYYKGYSLRDEHPKLGRWFDAIETRDVYRGTQSDFHTHVHDLPPQMGGCYFSHNCAVGKRPPEADLVDQGLQGAFLHTGSSSSGWSSIVPDVNAASRPYASACASASVDRATGPAALTAGQLTSASPKVEAAYRVLKHRNTMLDAFPKKSGGTISRVAVDLALRTALTTMLHVNAKSNSTNAGAGAGAGAAQLAMAATGANGSTPKPADFDIACRYIRDRINVPRDMSIWAAKELRSALERAAVTCGNSNSNSNRQGPELPFRHRRDQDPRPFVGTAQPSL